MVLRFTYPILLFCILLLTCGRGDAVKDLEEKYQIIVAGLENNKVDEVVDGKSSSQSSTSKIMKNLETHFRENVNNQFEETKSSSHQPSSKMMKDHNMEHRHHVGNAEVGLFTMDELRAFYVGKKLPIFFPIRDLSLYPPFFLPKKLAETIPFSSSQASTILQFFSVSPDSPKGKAVRDTLEECESKGPQVQTKICATSAESLLGFLRNAFGPEVDFKFISTSHPTITTPMFQNYTVLEPPREIQSAKKVACHPLPYLYAIYFCHIDANDQTKVFKLPLVGDSGDKVEALVVCHMDTSGWSSNHIAFRMLGTKKGNSFCHVFRQGDIVWIQPPSPVAAM